MGASLAADQEVRASEHCWPSTHLQLGGKAARSGQVGSPHLIYTSHTLLPENKPVKVLGLPGLLSFCFQVPACHGQGFFFDLSTRSPQGHLAK